MEDKKESAICVGLPLFKCHKEVRAAKILTIPPRSTDPLEGSVLGRDNGDKIIVTADWLKRNPSVEPGGYYVVYQDGYTAFSPAVAFEGGYARVDDSYQGRVVREKADLDEKLLKLVSFIDGEKPVGFTRASFPLLKRQAEIMTEYSCILGERIASF